MSKKKWFEEIMSSDPIWDSYWKHWVRDEDDPNDPYYDWEQDLDIWGDDDDDDDEEWHRSDDDDKDDEITFEIL